MIHIPHYNKVVFEFCHFPSDGMQTEGNVNDCFTDTS